MPLVAAQSRSRDWRPGGRGYGAAAGISVRLTVQPLSCAARTRVPKPERHAGCLHVKGAMQAA